MKGNKKEKKAKKQQEEVEEEVVLEDEEEEVPQEVLKKDKKSKNSAGGKKNNKRKHAVEEEEEFVEEEPEEVELEEEVDGEEEDQDLEQLDEDGDDDLDINSEVSQRENDRLRKEALEYREALAKRGVIYMSRVPPFMKPNKVRTLLEPYGEITRLFLAEEDAIHRKKRKEHGGNASKQFCEGWIEFADKKVAKSVAISLNNTSIGGRKGDYYHDDIWNLKYLKNFKWEYLTEKLAYERRVREQKMKTAMLQAKKSNAEMVQLIEKTKVQEIIQERKKKQRIAAGETNDSTFEARDGVDSKTIKRKFKQIRTIGKDYGENDNKVDGSVLNSIFAKSRK